MGVAREEVKVAGVREENLYSLPAWFFYSVMSLREISENVKLAREYALLGNYSSASVLYRGLLEQIKKYSYTLRDSSFQQRWQQVNISSDKSSSQKPWARFLKVTCFSAVARNKRGERSRGGHHVHSGELPAGGGACCTQQPP